jgi:hypothetical protein
VMEHKRCMKLALFILTLSIVLPMAATINAQELANQAAQEGNFLDVKIPEFKMHNETLLDGLWRLVRIPAPFRFGFEDLLKNRVMDPDIPGLGLNVTLTNKTYREILDALCQADPRFTWTVDEETVDVFPRAAVNDHSYLLNRKMAKFELKGATGVDDGLLAIVHQLPGPREQIAHVQMSGDDRYPPQPWTASFQDLTVRQVVNRLAAHGGACGVWTFGGSLDFRRFAFFNSADCTKKSPPAWDQTARRGTEAGSTPP